MVKHTRLRFDQGYVFSEDLELDSFNNGEDFIIGSLDSSSTNAILLGKIAEFNGDMGKNLWLDTKGAHVVYIMGKRRSGKSYTLGNIAEGLANKEFNTGNMNQAVLILDTLNIFWTMEHTASTDIRSGQEIVRELDKWGYQPERVRRLVCYYPKGFRQEYFPAHYLEFAIRTCDLDANDWAALFEVDIISDPMGQLISDLYERVVLEGYEQEGARIAPKSNYDIDDLLACLKHDEEIQRFDSRTIEAIRRRLKVVKRCTLFSSVGTDLRELFRPEQVAVLLLRDLDPQLRGLVIGNIVKRIIKLRGISCECKKRAEIKFKKASLMKERDSKRASQLQKEAGELQNRANEGLSRGWILIDEAHNYIPQIGIIGSKRPLKKFVNEGRNIGLSIAVTTQQPSGLDSSIRRNADILIIHSITMKSDIDVVENMLNTAVPSDFEANEKTVTSNVFEKMIRGIQIGYAIISCPNSNRIFVSKIRPRVSAHGGTEY